MPASRAGTYATASVRILAAPLPKMPGVADVEELLLPVQSEIVLSRGLCLPTEAFVLLTMDPGEVALIAVPAEHRPKSFVEFFGELSDRRPS